MGIESIGPWIRRAYRRGELEAQDWWNHTSQLGESGDWIKTTDRGNNKAMGVSGVCCCVWVIQHNLHARSAKMRMWRAYAQSFLVYKIFMIGAIWGGTLYWGTQVSLVNITYKILWFPSCPKWRIKQEQLFLSPYRVRWRSGKLIQIMWCHNTRTCSIGLSLSFSFVRGRSHFTFICWREEGKGKGISLLSRPSGGEGKWTLSYSR
jgi:hypothetical protein